MVQIQEAGRFDLMVRLITAAARDHGPAVFVAGTSPEDLLLVDVIIRHRIPVDLVAVGPQSDALRDFITRGYDLEIGRVRGADTVKEAVFGKNARITSARGSGANALGAYEYDADHGMLRFNPLAGWNEAEVRAYISAEGIECFEPASASCRPFQETDRVAA